MTTALVMLANPGSPDANGRMSHMLATAAQLRDAGEDVQMYFHGAGVNWATEFHKKASPFANAYAAKFEELKPLVAGACHFCTHVRFKQADELDALGIDILGGDGHHHTEADLILAGHRVVTF